MRDTCWVPVSGLHQCRKEELIFLGWTVSRNQSKPRATRLPRVGSAPVPPAQPCRQSGNAYALVRHFFKASKAVNFTPNEKRSSWLSGSGRLFAHRQGIAHGRELPSHRRNSPLLVCTQKAWMHQAAMKKLYFDHIVCENTVLPSNSGDYTGCRHLIIMFWAPHSCPGQPSALKAVMGH